MASREYGRALFHDKTYGKNEVAITKSSASMTKTNPKYRNGVTTYIPGQQRLIHKSPQHAVDHIEKHPSFKGWIGGKPNLSPQDEPEVSAAKKKVRDT